jgi:hypothetical protein
VDGFSEILTRSFSLVPNITAGRFISAQNPVWVPLWLTPKDSLWLIASPLTRSLIRLMSSSARIHYEQVLHDRKQARRDITLAHCSAGIFLFALDGKRISGNKLSLLVGIP